MYKNGSSKSEMGKLLGLVTVISKTPKRMKNTSLYFLKNLRISLLYKNNKLKKEPDDKSALNIITSIALTVQAD